ncbi:uncharacterized protein LOC144490273 [Mustelus asterias]
MCDLKKEIEEWKYRSTVHQREGQQHEAGAGLSQSPESSALSQWGAGACAGLSQWEAGAGAGLSQWGTGAGLSQWEAGAGGGLSQWGAGAGLSQWEAGARQLRGRSSAALGRHLVSAARAAAGTGRGQRKPAIVRGERQKAADRQRERVGTTPHPPSAPSHPFISLHPSGRGGGSSSREEELQERLRQLLDIWIFLAVCALPGNWRWNTTNVQVGVSEWVATAVTAVKRSSQSHGITTTETWITDPMIGNMNVTGVMSTGSRSTGATNSLRNTERTATVIKAMRMQRSPSASRAMVTTGTRTTGVSLARRKPARSSCSECCLSPPARTISECSCNMPDTSLGKYVS